MSDNNQMMSVQGQLVGMPLAGPESFSQQQLEYLKRALGIDETVLWSGTRRSSVTLSESAYNFEFIRIELDEGNSNAPDPVITIKPKNIMSFCFGFGDANAFIALVKATLTDNTALAFSATKSLKFGSFTSTQVSITAELNNDQVTNSIVKVVGVHRIAGGNQ